MSDTPRRTFRHEVRTRSDARAEVDEELAYHLDRCVEELVAGGWSESEARAEAERRFGDLDATRAVCTAEHARARAGTRRGRHMDEFAQDVKYALRTLRRSPTYATVVVATLAVGIALNTLVFSLMNPYLVRALPYAEPDRLVAVGGVDRLEGWDLGRFSPPQIADLRDRTRAFDDLGHYYYTSVNVTGGEGAERITAAFMSGNLFGLLGTEAVRGRTPGADDVRPGAPDAVVVSHSLWTRRLGADPAAVGTQLELDGTPHTVVGVMPPDFSFPYNAVDLWLPHPGDRAASDREAMNSLVVGRLAAGWTADAARTEISGIQADLARAHPESDGRYDTLSVKSLREALNFAWEILRPGFWILLA
ncbi:MAG: ABC transporter permease, partial [Longimicrobiales bacterium]